MPMLSLVAPPEQTATATSEQAAMVYLSGLGSPVSRATQTYSLEVASRTLTTGQLGWEELPWVDLRYQHVAALRAALAQTYAPATTNKILSAVRGVLRECWRLRLIAAEDYQRVADCGPIRGVRLPAGRFVTNDEVSRLFESVAADRGPIGRRDEALLAVLIGSGLRREEAAALRLEHVDIESGELVVLRGKGNRDRITYLGADALSLLRGWLRVRGAVSGPLFYSLTAGGGSTMRKLSGQGIYMAVQRRAEEAHLRHLTLHDFRRTYISRLLGAGQDIATIGKMVGHQNPVTTASYDRRADEAKAVAANMIRLPLVGRA
jgi:integrase/recombinase XerD